MALLLLLSSSPSTTMTLRISSARRTATSAAVAAINCGRRHKLKFETTTIPTTTTTTPTTTTTTTTTPTTRTTRTTTTITSRCSPGASRLIVAGEKTECQRRYGAFRGNLSSSSSSGRSRRVLDSNSRSSNYSIAFAGARQQIAHVPRPAWSASGFAVSNASRSQLAKPAVLSLAGRPLLPLCIRSWSQSYSGVRTMTSLSPQDPTSFSRPEEAEVKSFHWDVVVDFENRVLRGHVDLDVHRKKADAEFLHLDSSQNLVVKEALCVNSGQKLELDRTQSNKIFGVCTRVRLPSEGDRLKVRIPYETHVESSALQWLSKAQTAGGHKPYVYSHSEAIHSRGLLPCQDSPNVKSSFTVKMQVPEDLVAVVAAVKVGEEKGPENSRVFLFEQKIPVPIYLLAFAVGDIQSRKIGPRSHVWAEKEYVDKAVIDFADTEEMIKTAEDLMGPYVWGTYDLLVLPPSFPFGGMENPCLTFMTPTVLAGDKSLADVVTHEISHSWTGNLVTNKTFEHFWLNEGFTMYVERKIIGRMLGEDRRQFSAQEGIKGLQYAIDSLGKDNPLTKLVVDLRGVDPDDSFSSVPYEKGHTFLYYLETLLGCDAMDHFLKAYVERFKFKSIDTNDWKSFMYEFFADKKQILDKVDWDAWLYSPGMPPVVPEYKSSLAVPCIALSKKWNDASQSEVLAFTKQDFTVLDSRQKQEFFSELLQGSPLSAEKVAHLSTLYDMESIHNAEIRFRWMRVGILARWKGILEPVKAFLNVVGRMKFVVPLYRDLFAWPDERQFAEDLYEKNKGTMMYVTKHAVDKAKKEVTS